MVVALRHPDRHKRLGFHRFLDALIPRGDLVNELFFVFVALVPGEDTREQVIT